MISRRLHLRRARLLCAAALMAALALGPATARPEPEGEEGKREVELGDRERGEREGEEGETSESIQARLEWRYRRRLDANGRIEPGALLRAKQQLDARKAHGPKTEDAGIWNWEWLGPGNIGGRVRALVILPSNPNWMWAGTAGGGIWRTTNAGASWSPMSDFLPSLPVASLALDPIATNTLYAGTGELIGSNSNIPGAGIYKSTTSGLLWTQLPSTDNLNFHYVSVIAHHPLASGRLLAGTNRGVFRSIDGGTSWQFLFIPPNGAAVRDIQYSPTDSSVIAVGTQTDMYLSTNSGRTFVPQTTSAPGKMTLSSGDCTIRFAPSNTQIIYVQVGKDQNVANTLVDTLYRSSNGGSTWAYWKGTNADRWSNALWVSPTNPDFVVWGGFGDLRRSTNGTNEAWISDGGLYASGQSAHGDQHAIVAHPGYNGGTNRIVFVANDGGVQKASDISTVSTNLGWTNLANNLGVTQFFSGATDNNGTVVLGGNQDNGTVDYRPLSGQQGWTHPGGGDGGYCAVDPMNPQRLFISAQLSDLWKSSDGGVNYFPIRNGITDPADFCCFDFIPPFVMDPNNSNTLWLGGVRIWRTTDGGNNWTQRRPATFGNPKCTAIDVAKSNSNVIWIGYDDGLISHSIDGGLNWIGHVVLPQRYVTDIAVNPLASNEVVVTFAGYSNDNVWFTNDNGGTWQLRTGSPPNELPSVQVNTVRYHPLQPNWIYVGTDLGVFASEDKGLTWSVTPRYSNNEGPNNVEVDELFWQGTTHLLAATHGRGMYRCTPLPIVYVDKNWTGFEDGSQAYPFNTVDEAVNAYGPGAIVSIKSNTYGEPPLTITKRGTFRATNGTVRIQ